MKTLTLSSLLISLLAAGSLAAADNTNAINPGGNVALNVNTNGSPTLHYQWYAGGGTNAGGTNVALAASSAGPMPTNGLYLNFQDVPLNAVLNYLSEKAGLVVISDADLRGHVSVVAKQPVTTNELVDILNDALSRNGYAATLDGRTLRVMTRSASMTAATTPVMLNTNYTSISESDRVVTEILPIQSLDPEQLVKDLEPLIPSGDTVTANQSGNAVLMTAPEKDVRRIAQIITDLDSSSVSDVEVFILRYADAKSVADELKEVFQSPDSDAARATSRNSFRFRGGGGFGGMFGGMGGGGGSDQNKQNNLPHAVFTSDDQANAVIAAAPPAYMPSITNVIHDLDQPSDEVTMVRVFHLKYADPTELADEFSTLFQIQSPDQNNTRTMGFRFMPPWMQQQPGNSGQSDRMKRENAVQIVADRRTQSVVVTASREMMDQIASVIEQLDSTTAGIQHVKAFPIDAADPTSAQQTLSALFANPNHPQPASSQTTDALSARNQGTINSQQSSASQQTAGFGTTGGGGGIP